MVQKIIGDKLMTDRQTKDIFESTLIHKENLIFFFFFFFCIWQGENEWGEIYSSLLGMQVRFAHLLRSQRDNVECSRGCKFIPNMSLAKNLRR
jgi:hypothetical protein